MDFTHNFCESRLNEFKSPEIWNSYSALVISIIPFLFKTPLAHELINVKYLLIFNGIGSFIYHYYLNWLGKHLDEISMILCNYFGINYLLNIYFLNNKLKKNKKDFLKTINLYFCVLFTSLNTLPNLDYLFPNLFAVYLIPTIYLIYYICNNFDINKHFIYFSLGTSSIGVVSWIISENYCTEFTKYGHVIWHLLFPFGFYRVIDYLDGKFNKNCTDFIKIDL